MATTERDRKIGGVGVGSLGLGCMGMTLTYGRPDKRLAGETLSRAVELGVVLFDTADMYGAGANERFVGEALRRHRDGLVLATKFGLRSLPLLGLPIGVDGRPEYARRAIDRSLRRLRTDRIDLYYLHRPDPRVPIEESVGAMAELVEAGKVRHLGLSEVSADQLRRAAAVHPIAAVQSEWSIFSRDLEAEVLPAAREIGATIVPYSPLGRGMLTGSARATDKLPLLDYRRSLPRWRAAHLSRNLIVVERLRQIAADLDITPAQLALAWLLAQGPDVVPIPGTTQPRYLEQNLAAVGVELSAQTMAELSSVVASGARQNPN